MNFLELRNAVGYRLGHKPVGSAEYTTRLKSFINQAYRLVALDLPFHPFLARYNIVTQVDFAPTEPTDKISISGGDPWVFARDVAATGAIIPWEVNRKWDGRWMGITSTTGNELFCQVREIWTESPGDTQKFTVTQPWENNSDTALSYRFFTPYYHLPPDCLKVHEILPRGSSGSSHYPLDYITLSQALREGKAYWAVNDTNTSVPRDCWEGESFQMFRPTTTPIVTAQGTWSGNVPAGARQYCATLCWGYEDDTNRMGGPDGALLSSITSRKKPRWESPPSPISASITPVSLGSGVRVTLPNIAADIGFGVTGTARRGRSGWYWRIYVRMDGTPTGGFAPAESSTHFRALVDWGLDSGPFDDDGTILPEFESKLLEDNSYRSIHFWPRPSNRVEMDCLYVRQPPMLEDDFDSPLLGAEIAELIIEQAIKMVRNQEGKLYDLNNPQQSTYPMVLSSIRKNHGLTLSYSKPHRTKLTHGGQRHRV